MTCSRKSTTWCGSRALVLACALPLWAAGEAAVSSQAETATPPEAVVRQAIVEAVQERMGRDADVRIEELHIGPAPAAGAPGARLVARPEPGARAGRAVRFALARLSSGGSRTAGYAVAKVYVAIEHARAARAIERGEILTGQDIQAARSEVGAMPLQPLPLPFEIVGARALRDVSPDEVLTRSVAAVRQTGRSGDTVSLAVNRDGVTAQTQGVATQGGQVGQTIRVVNAASRRSVRARVVAPGKVEVVQ